MVSERSTLSRCMLLTLFFISALACNAEAAQNSQLTARDLKSCANELHTLKASLLVGYDQKLSKLKTQRNDDLQMAELKLLERYKSELESSNGIDWYMRSIGPINQMRSAKEVRLWIAQQKTGPDTGEATKAASAAQVCIARLRLARLERASAKHPRNEPVPGKGEENPVSGPLSDQDCFQRLLKIQNDFKDKRSSEKDMNIAQKKLFEGVCSQNPMAGEYVTSANGKLGIATKKPNGSVGNAGNVSLPRQDSTITGTATAIPMAPESTDNSKKPKEANGNVSYAPMPERGTASTGAAVPIPFVPAPTFDHEE